MDHLFLLLDRLRQLLEEERAALLAGDPERIMAAAEHKQALADQIDAAAAATVVAPAANDLTRLARYNRDNAVICAAMLRHMTQALDRLRQYAPHRSYRADGTERNPASRTTLGAA
jgi:flagellar biosynthesis/type III secretory pathway chaperone